MSSPILLDGDAITCGDTARAPDRGFTINGIPVVLLGDLSQGHDGFPPTPVVEGSSILTLNGVPVALDGALYVDHVNDDDVHTNRRGISNARFTIEG